MMRLQFLIVAGVALGTLVLAGCAANGHLATPGRPPKRHLCARIATTLPVSLTPQNTKRRI